MTTSRLGIGIISFDRPSYLRRLVSSLERQTDLGNVDFHLFQDGAINRFSGAVRAKQEDIDTAVWAFERSELPNKRSHVQAGNVSVAINQWEAYEWLTERYERVIVLEDDVVFSPYWLRLVRVLFGGLEARPDVFGFSTGFQLQCGAEEIDDNLDRIFYGTPHWWMIAFMSDRWQRIRSHFLDYYALVRDIDYAQRPHAEVRELFSEKGWDQRATSQDGGKDMAVHAAGMKRAVLVVNRGMSIGQHGIHFTPKRFRRLGFADQRPFIFESDAEREMFSWPD